MVVALREWGRTRSGTAGTSARTGRLPAHVPALAMLLAGWLWIVAAPFAYGVEITYNANPVQRQVLALYDGKAEPTPTDTRIHRFAEMPLNYLGFVLVYRDVNKGLPDTDALSQYTAVLTWFLEPLADPRGVGDWLTRATTSARLRYVVLGEVLPEAGEEMAPVTDRLYAKLGLADGDDQVEVTIGSSVAEIDAAMIGFERPLDKVLPSYPVLRAVGERTRVHLGLQVRPGTSSEVSAVVVTGPGGGYAAEAFTIYFEPNADRIAWTIDPFRFFAKALGGGIYPVPDATTVAGRRIYFSHIDGDGWNNLTEVESYKAEGLRSSEVVLREAIKPFPDLPVSIGLIGCDVDPQYGADDGSAGVARALYALPQVEVASHTHTHPYNWSFFEAYDRASEIAKIEAYQRPELSLRQRLSEKVHLMAGKPVPVTGANKYIAGTDDLPRTYLKNPFDLGGEVAGGLRTAESFAPAGKRARLYQWSGDTTPFEAAIKATRTAGVRNINGGDSRLDGEFPSVAYVPPLARTVGNERQIYAANSNENTYTNDWTGPYYGFFMLEETLRNTEQPRRLKPFNLYYHMYSGEKPAALAAVRHFLELARTSDVAPVSASDYAAIADNFFDIAIERVDELSWAITGHTDLETVRFDDADALGLDLARSDGVLGATRANGALYVTLDRARPRALVTLAARPDAEAANRSGARRPSLRDSRWRLSDLEGSACNLKLAATGYGPGDMRFDTLPGRRYDVTVMRGDEMLTSVSAVADDSGVLRLALAANALDPVQLRLVCRD